MSPTKFFTPSTNPPTAPETTGPAYATRLHCFSCSAHHRILRYGPDGERTLCNPCYLCYTRAKLPLYLHPSGKLTALPPATRAAPILNYAFRYLDPQGRIIAWRHLCLNPRIAYEGEGEGRTRSGNQFRLSWEGGEVKSDGGMSLIPRLSREIYEELCNSLPKKEVSSMGRKRPRACPSPSAAGERKDGRDGGEKVACIDEEVGHNQTWNGCIHEGNAGERGPLTECNKFGREGDDRDEGRRRVGQEDGLVGEGGGRADPRRRGRQEGDAGRQVLFVADGGALATTTQEYVTRNDETEGRMAELISVKAYFTRGSDVSNSYICRFKLNASLPFEGLVRELQLLFKINDLLYVFYIDGEGDEVSLTSDNEMLELFDIVRRSGISPVRMKVMPRVF